MKLLVSWVDLHIGEELLQALCVDEGLTHGNGFESCLQVHELLGSEHLLDRNMLHTEVGPVLFCTLHCFLKNASRVHQAKLRDIWHLEGVLEMRFFLPFICILVVYFGIDSSLRLVFDPFTDEQFVLGVVEVTALAFAHIVNPVALKVVTVSLS